MTIIKTDLDGQEREFEVLKPENGQTLMLYRQYCDFCGEYDQMVSRCERCQKHACIQCKRYSNTPEICQIDLSIVVRAARGF